MLLLPILIACFIQLQQSLLADSVAKCCPKNFEVRELSNNSLECIEQTYSRRDVWAESYNLLEETDEGECVDLSARNFFLFTFNSSNLVSKNLVSPSTIFPKCCPLNHVYDKATHSCVAQLNSTKDFVEGQLIEIGLPRCRTILDNAFKSGSEASDRARGLEQGTYCLDRDVKDAYVVRECQEGLNVCKQKRCFRKCCSDGQSFVNGGICRDTYVHGLKIESQGFTPYIVDPEDEHELIYGVKCNKVQLLASNTIQYTIKKRGEFYYFHKLNGTFMEYDFADPRSYCLEHVTKGNLSGYHMFWCLNDTPLDAKFSYTLWSKILSCVFLVLTIVIYFYLGEVKSTFGKILINYCLTMIFLMVTLIVTHVSRQPDRLSCKIRAYLLIFFNMSAFAWINVMSLDIWWTFGTPRRTIGSDQRKKDLKKFLLYFLYGWGLPLCHTLIILVFESTSVLPEPVHPYVGIFSCFLENRNHARTVLILVPQLIFQIINTVLFIKTITYCIRVKNEIIKMNDTTKNRENGGRFSADRERLGLIVKLAVIMGVIWIFEVTTAFFNMKTYSDFTKILEVILDNVTCLQGVFIFLIFICKKKTFNSLKNKLKIGERRISCSMSVTQSSHVNGHYPMNKRQTTTLSLNESKI